MRPNLSPRLILCHDVRLQGDGFRERRNQDVAEIFRGTQAGIGRSKGSKGDVVVRDPILQVWLGCMPGYLAVALR